MTAGPTPVFPVKTIAFATDFLLSSRLALDYAVAFAHHYRAKLRILHVFHPSQAAAEAEVLYDGPSMSRRDREARLEAFASGARRANVEVNGRSWKDGCPTRCWREYKRRHRICL